MKILVVNPGSTSTKIALFENQQQLFSASLDMDGIDYTNTDGEITLNTLVSRIAQMVSDRGYDLKTITAFVGRSGNMVASPAGTFEVNQKLLDASEYKNGNVHALRYSPHIVKRLSVQFGGRAFVVNSQQADELDILARFTGYTDVWRESGLHVLNHKEVGNRMAAVLGKKYSDSNLIIAHLGGGISVAAHKHGKIVDYSGGGGEGPMAPNRSGTIRALSVINLAYSNQYTKQELLAKTNIRGGLQAHLCTSDAREVERRINAGDAYAKLAYDSMIYQIGKYIAAMAAVLNGNVDSIVLTGGMANSKYLTERVKNQVGWIAPLEVMPGEFEMEGFSNSALRVLTGEEKAVEYTGVPVFSPAEMESMRQTSLATYA